MILLRHRLVIGLMEAITSVSRRSKALRSIKFNLFHELIKLIEHMNLILLYKTIEIFYISLPKFLSVIFF